MKWILVFGNLVIHRPPYEDQYEEKEDPLAIEGPPDEDDEFVDAEELPDDDDPEKKKKKKKKTIRF